MYMLNCVGKCFYFSLLLLRFLGVTKIPRNVINALEATELFCFLRTYNLVCNTLYWSRQSAYLFSSLLGFCQHVCYIQN